MLDWILRVLTAGGALGVGLLTLLENVFPPIPSELIVPLAGYLAARGQMSFWGVVASGTVGSLAGTAAWYWVGRRVGQVRVRRWVERHGKWLLLDADDVARSERWFRERGAMAVFAGRLVPGVRSLISLPAGFNRMPLVPFLLYSAAGSFLWILALAWAGRMLGARYEEVERFLEPVLYLVVAVGIGALVARRLRRGRGKMRADARRGGSSGNPGRGSTDSPDRMSARGPTD